MPVDPIIALREALLPASRPLAFSKLLTAWTISHDEAFPLSESELAGALADETSAGPLREVLRGKLAGWDHVASAEGDWTAGSAPNSVERRERIYELLEPSPELLETIREALPP